MLESWAEKGGVDLAKQAVELSDTNGGPQLVASRATPRGENLLSVPDNLWVTPQSVASSSIGSMVQELPPWIQIALFLLSERARGHNSPWSAYVQALPSHPPSPLLWPQDARKLLESTQLLQSLEGYEEYFESEYAQLCEMFEEHREDFPSDIFTSEAFRWAAVTVRSRSHAPLDGDSLALAPLTDLVGHSRGDGVSLTIEKQRLRGGRFLKMSAGRAFSAGESLVMDFGPSKLDSQLILDYGVLDESQPQGGYVLELSLSEEDRNYGDKADILELNELPDPCQFQLRADRPPEGGLLAFLRLLNCSGSDSFLLEALFRNDAWGFMMQPVSEANEDALCRSMIEGCREALSAYPSSIDEDLELLRDDDAVPRGSATRAAVMIRLGEKEGLDMALRYFEDRKSRLEDIEYYQERRLKGLGLLDDDGETTWDGFFEKSMF